MPTTSYAYPTKEQLDAVVWHDDFAWMQSEPDPKATAADELERLVQWAKCLNIIVEL